MPSGCWIFACSASRPGNRDCPACVCGDNFPLAMVHIIDTLQLQRTKIIAVTVLETNDGLACFDCGPESTFDNVVAGMKAVGLSPDDVRHLFLSHIHFDHAGAAWRLAEKGATVYVHPRGAPHSINPAKLIE